MFSGSDHARWLRPSQEKQARETVDAWLQHELRERHGWVAAESLPECLLRLLPDPEVS